MICEKSRNRKLPVRRAATWRCSQGGEESAVTATPPRGNLAVRPLRGASSQVGNRFCLRSIQLQEFADNSQACPRKVDVPFAVKFSSH